MHARFFFKRDFTQLIGIFEEGIINMSGMSTHIPSPH